MKGLGGVAGRVYLRWAARSQRPASAWSCVSLQPHLTARVQLQAQKGEGVGFTQHGVASMLLECSPLTPFSSLTWATVRASHESPSGETPTST